MKKLIVNANQTYAEWLADQQKKHGIDTIDTLTKKVKNVKTDRKQYNNYISVIGKENMSKTFAKFQDLKYNDSGGWKDLKDLYKAHNNGRVLYQHLDYVWQGEKGFIPAGTALTNIHVIAGSGSDTTLRIADLLADKYGGKPNEWSKKVGKVTSEKYIFDIHWYEHDKQQYEPKVKLRKDKD